MNATLGESESHPCCPCLRSAGAFKQKTPPSASSSTKIRIIANAKRFILLDEARHQHMNCI